MSLTLPAGEKIGAATYGDFNLLLELANEAGATFTMSGSGSIVTALEYKYYADGTAVNNLDQETPADYKLIQRAIAPFIEPFVEDLTPSADELIDVSFSHGKVEPGNSQRSHRWHSDKNLAGIMVASALPPEIASGQLEHEHVEEFEKAMLGNQPDEVINRALGEKLLTVIPSDALDIVSFNTAHIHRSAINTGENPVTRSFLRVRKYSRS